MSRQRGAALLNLVLFLAAVGALLSYSAQENQSAAVLARVFRMSLTAADRAKNNALRTGLERATKIAGPWCENRLGFFGGFSSKASICGLSSGAGFPLLSFRGLKAASVCLKHAKSAFSLSAQSAVDCVSLKESLESFIISENINAPNLSFSPLHQSAKAVCLGKITVGRLSGAGILFLAAVGDINIEQISSSGGRPLEVFLFSRRGDAAFRSVEGRASARIIKPADLSALRGEKEPFDRQLMPDFLPLGLFLKEN